MSAHGADYMIGRARAQSTECVEALRALILMKNDDPMLWFRAGEALAAAIGVAAALDVAEQEAKR